MIKEPCECGGELVGIEYPITDKYHSRGYSETNCMACGKRVGRWCGQELTTNQIEPPACSGGMHPRVIYLGLELIDDVA